MAYSFSKLQIYVKCPMQYRLDEIDDEDPISSKLSLPLILGSCAHGALEDLYKSKSDMMLMNKEQLIESFENRWNFEISKAVELRGGQNPFNQYDLDSFHNRGVDYMNRYYDKFSPFDQAIAMKMESPISFEIEEGLDFSGKIDRLDFAGDTLIINDYKTNKSLPKDGNNYIEDQITLYAIGVLRDYGKQIKHLKGRVIYLHLLTPDDDPHEWDITNEKIEEVKNKYLGIIKEIEYRKKRLYQGDEEAFPTSGSNYTCADCLFKHLCPKYKHMYVKDEKLEINDLGEDTIRKWVDRYAKINDQSKTLKKQAQDIGGLLAKFAKDNGVTRLYGENKKATITTKTTYSKDKDYYDKLRNKLIEENKLEDVLDIDFNKLGKEFKEGDLNYEDYKELVKKTTSIYIGNTYDIKEDELNLDVLGNEELI